MVNINDSTDFFIEDRTGTTEKDIKDIKSTAEIKTTKLDDLETLKPIRRRVKARLLSENGKK